MIKNTRALQRALAKVFNTSAGEKIKAAFIDKTDTPLLSKLILEENPNSSVDTTPYIFNKTGYKSEVKERLKKGYFTKEERLKGKDKFGNPITEQQEVGFYKPTVNKSSFNDLIKDIDKIGKTVENKSEQNVIKKFVSDLNKSAKKTGKNWSKDSSLFGEFFDSADYFKILDKKKPIQDVIPFKDISPTISDYRRVLGTIDNKKLAQVDPSVRKVYNMLQAKKSPSQPQTTLRDIKSLALKKIEELGPKDPLKDLDPRILDVLEENIDDVGFTGAYRGSLSLPRQFRNIDDEAVIPQSTPKQKDFAASNPKSASIFLEEDYLNRLGGGEFDTPEMRQSVIGEARKKYFDRIRAAEPSLLDTESTAIQKVNIKLPKDMTREEFLNLPEEERRFLGQAQEVYNETFGRAKQSGYNTRDSDAIAQEEVLQVMLGRADRSISGTIMGPEEVLARKYKSSITGKKKPLLPEEKPEYTKGEQYSLFGEKQYPVTGRFTFKKKNKGGLAGLTTKKKFIPKIIKNKKLKKRKQQKPRGVGKALRGYGATSG
jgi:hypothetical protein